MITFLINYISARIKRGLVGCLCVYPQSRSLGSTPGVPEGFQAKRGELKSAHAALPAYLRPNAGKSPRAPVFCGARSRPRLRQFSKGAWSKLPGLLCRKCALTCPEEAADLLTDVLIKRAPPGSLREHRSLWRSCEPPACHPGFVALNWWKGGGSAEGTGWLFFFSPPELVKIKIKQVPRSRFQTSGRPALRQPPRYYRGPIKKMQSFQVFLY